MHNFVSLYYSDFQLVCCRSLGGESFIDRAIGGCQPPASSMVRLVNYQKLMVCLDNFSAFFVCQWDGRFKITIMFSCPVLFSKLRNPERFFLPWGSCFKLCRPFAYSFLHPFLIGWPELWGYTIAFIYYDTGSLSFISSSYIQLGIFLPCTELKFSRLVGNFFKGALWNFIWNVFLF